MEPNKIVVQFKDGRILKGKTNDLFQNKESFHIDRGVGQIEAIEVENLKSVFFVKDIKGNPGYIYKYKDTVPGGGRKIAIEFQDGEKIIGYVLGYSPQRQGFMMTPADSDGNNERIFVVKSATKSVSFITDDHTSQKSEIPQKSEHRDSGIKGERRKSARVSSDNLLSYVCFDEDQRPLEQGMGKTLDIGLGGLLMETKVPIEAQYILLMVINLKEELIKIKGKVAFSRESAPKIFNTGIRFMEEDEKIREVVIDMLKSFVETKAG